MKNEPYIAVYSTYHRWSAIDDGDVDVTDAWRRWYEVHLKCRGCFRPKRAWQVSPKPIPVECVGRNFRGLSFRPLGFPSDFWRLEFLDSISRYLPSNMVLSPCNARGEYAEAARKYAAIHLPSSEYASKHRGAGNGHMICDGCGFMACPSWGDEGFVKHEVCDRPIVFDDFSGMYIIRPLALELKIGERFPDYRGHKVPVLDEAKDGYVLPGDPGWDGVLRPPPGWRLDGKPIRPRTKSSLPVLPLPVKRTPKRPTRRASSNSKKKRP